MIALETIGADCFYHSMQANLRLRDHTLPSGVTLFHDDEYEVGIARLPAITSVASSLGASSTAPGAVKMALQREGGVRCVCVPDGLSMQAGLAFAGSDFRIFSMKNYINRSQCGPRGSQVHRGFGMFDDLGSSIPTSFI